MFSKDKSTKDGFCSQCKECVKIRLTKYKSENADKVSASKQNWLKNNLDYVRPSRSKENPEQYAIFLQKRREAARGRKQDPAKSKAYYEKNKDKVIARTSANDRIRRKNDPLYAFRKQVRSTIATRAFSGRKSKSTEQILGCTIDFFISYIESKFEPWMNWSNRGLYNGTFNFGWDVDHIIPISSAKTQEEAIKLSHYTNLQPLCSKVNRDIKRDK